jgi:uncharacterized protein
MSSQPGQLPCSPLATGKSLPAISGHRCHLLATRRCLHARTWPRKWPAHLHPSTLVESGIYFTLCCTPGVYTPPSVSGETRPGQCHVHRVPYPLLAALHPRYTLYAIYGAAMPIPQYLLDILICPACKTPVKPAPDNSSFKCQSPTCRRVYPVRDEIPVMLIEESTVAPE